MRIAIAAILVSLAVFPAAAHAEPARAEPNDEMWIGGNLRALRTASANALTAKNLDGTSVGYARALGVAVGPGASVWAEASITTGSAEGTLFQSMSTELDAVALTAGVRLRLPLHRLIAASAHAGLGAQRVRVAIDAPGASATDHGWGGLASASAALDLLAVARPRFGFGVRAELGYVVARPIAITPARTSSDDVLMLPISDVSLGEIDLSGAALTLSLVGQF